VGQGRGGGHGGARRGVEGLEGSEGRVCLCFGLCKSELRPSVLGGRVELGFKVLKFFALAGHFRGRACSVLLLI
jgi:hypothetical protein